MPGSRSERKDPWTGIRDSQYMPAAAITAPATITGLVPIAGEQLGRDAGGDPDREAQREVGGAGLDR